MSITQKKFYMIRHGQSEANAAKYFSGNLDVSLTDKGRNQAEVARAHVEKLVDKPVQIIHSHLSRARDTATIINQNLQLPMTEISDLGEHHFGEWERESWDAKRPLFDAGENPPGGETHDEFAARVKRGLNTALEMDGPVLIACHGGIFRAFYKLYDNFKNFNRIENCKLYSFTPNPSRAHFPWDIEMIG